jgi:C1A family cysteine protease
MDQAFEYARDNEEYTEENYRYTARDETCKAASHAGETSVKDSGYVDIAQDLNAFKKALTEGPMAVAVDASNWSSYRGGIFSNCGTGLNHGVLAVGYNSESITIKNSWGTTWGEKGFIRLALGNTCGVLEVASYPTF